MRVLKMVRKSKTLVGLKKDLSSMIRLYHILNRKKLIKRYFKKEITKKLHLGSHITLLDGWLCSDILPQNKKSIYLDVAKKFPFEDETFDYIYSEHLIEHLSQADGLFMLKECLRVLKKKSKIRIATPDLEVIVNLYSKRNEKYGVDYIKWSMDNFVENHCGYSPVVVMNTLFHNWFHQFLYDFGFLKETMNKVGFTDIVRLSVGKSNDSVLKGIERHHINVGSYEMIDFETLVVEAVKK